MVENLKVKIALDTQILAYLVDNTYPSLTKFIEELSESNFVELCCSQFATYEFIGIRKVEHYLRSLVNKTGSQGGQVNFSSALKYKNEFNAPELKYEDVSANIRNIIDTELGRIHDDFNIEYNAIGVHEGLWGIHKDLVLQSKISKEDCLLLLSCMFPEPFSKEDNLSFITNDNQFYHSFSESPDAIYNACGLKKPKAFQIRNIASADDKVHNLTETQDQIDLSALNKNFIAERVKEKYDVFYLGKVISCACNSLLKKELLCFELEQGRVLPDNVYITILNPELELYNLPVRLTNFQCQGNTLNMPYTAPEEEHSRLLAVKLLNENGELLPEEVMKRITLKDSLVFIHPENDV